MSAAESDWSRYLASVCEEYADWWDKYTLTDVTGKQQTKASKGDGLLLDLRAETVPEKEGDNLPGSQPGVGQAEKVERFTVLEGLRKYAKTHVLLCGAPGSGKSTAMVRLLLEEAEKVRASQPSNVVVAGNARVVAGSATVVGRKPLEIPVMLELRYYDKSLLGLIEEALLRHDPAIDISELEQWLVQGRFLLLLDGVNELPSDMARRNVLRFRRKYEKTTPMVFSTRQMSEGGDLSIRKKLTMQPLSEAQMREFVQAYLPGQEEAMLAQLGDRLREFGEVPLLLWMLCSVYAHNQQQLPTNLGGVFRKFTQLYDEKLKQDVPDPHRSKLFWRDLLQVLAFRMVEGHGEKDPLVAISRREAEEAIRSFYQESKGEDSLEQARLCLEDLLNYHLIQVGATGCIQFRHQLIQEYYAAEKLLEKLAGLSDEDMKWQYLNYCRKWTEPVALMTGLVSEEAQALRLVKLALEIDYELGARLAGAIREDWQSEAVILISNLEISPLLSIYLLGVAKSIAAVPMLLALLKDEELAIRIQSANILGKIGHESAVPGLLSTLKDEDPDVRMRVTDALGEIGGTSATLGLLNALENCNTRLNAAVALGEIGSEAAVSKLLYVLRDANSPIRGNVAHVLGKIHETSAVPELLTLLEDKDEYVRSSAIGALGKIGNTVAISGLLNALRDENTYIRSSTAETLSKIDSATVVPLLLDALKSENCNVRCGTAYALGRIGDVTAVHRLLDLLRDKDCIVRSSSADALGQIGDACAVPDLVTLLSDESSYVRCRGAVALGDIGSESSVSKLLPALRSKDLQVRSSVAEALGKIGSELAVPNLSSALEDKDLRVRNSAIVALGEIGSEKSVPSLLAVLRDKERDVRSNAASSLGRIGSTKTVSGLLHVLTSDEDPYVRVHASYALGEIGNAEAIAGLLDALEDRDPYVRRRVIDTLGKVGNTDAVSRLLLALEDEDAYVRSSAAYALGEIGSIDVASTLVTGLKDQDRRVRSGIVRALGKIRDEKTVPQILSTLEDEDWEVRKNAANALMEISNAAAISGLIDGLVKADHPFILANTLKQAQAKLGYFRPPIKMTQDSPSLTSTKILILATNPKSTIPLRLDQEIRDIEEGLQRARHRDRVTLISKRAVRPQDLQRAMLEERPQIVHFSGHGKGEAGLYFEDNQGHPYPIIGEALANLFKLFAPAAQAEGPITCVLLNGCYSAVQAEEIAKHIPYVIGMSQSIGDTAAIEFAVGFYDALGNGKSVEFAFSFAKAAMGLSETGSKDVPILIKS